MGFAYAQPILQWFINRPTRRMFLSIGAQRKAGEDGSFVSWIQVREPA
jgi:hypothetical protein